MFDIGLQEFLVIGILVLLFFPPDDLPALFRQAGRLYAKVRRASDDLRRAFNAEVARVENEARLDELRQRRVAAQRARDEAPAAGKPLPEAAESEPDLAHDDLAEGASTDSRLPPDAARRRAAPPPPASVGRPAPFAPPPRPDPAGPEPASVGPARAGVADAAGETVARSPDVESGRAVSGGVAGGGTPRPMIEGEA